MRDEADLPAPLLDTSARVVGHDGVPACAPVSLGPDSALALIGRNGAGKSTLLHTLVGLLPPLEAPPV